MCDDSRDKMSVLRTPQSPSPNSSSFLHSSSFSTGTHSMNSLVAPAYLVAAQLVGRNSVRNRYGCIYKACCLYVIIT